MHTCTSKLAQLNLLCRGSCFIYGCGFIYVYWCPARLPFQMMFVSFNSNTTGVTSRAGTANPSGTPQFTPRFQRGSCYSIFGLICVVLYIVVCPFAFGHCVLCPSLIYGFWFPLWYLRFTDSGFSFGILDLQILVSPLVSQIYRFWFPLWYLRFTNSGFPFDILDLQILVSPLVSQIYGFWFPLWYLRFTDSGFPFSILDLRILVSSLVSQIYRFWFPLWYLRFTDSGLPFGILKPVLNRNH